MFYRRSDSQNPMSNWGHAMFANNTDSIDGYGANLFTFDGSNAVSIEDLKDAIMTAWEESQETGDFGEMCDAYYESLTADEVFEGLNPENIVDSAQAYDCDIMVWFYSKVLEPNNIVAVITNDGAVVWDESLINKAEED